MMLPKKLWYVESELLRQQTDVFLVAQEAKKACPVLGSEGPPFPAPTPYRVRSLARSLHLLFIHSLRTGYLRPLNPFPDDQDLPEDEA